MSRNKFTKYGKSCWEENRRLRNLVVKIRKHSMRKYFEERCSKQDKNGWKTISQFFSDKKLKNGNHVVFSENNDIINNQLRVAKMFNQYLLQCCFRRLGQFGDGRNQQTQFPPQCTQNTRKEKPWELSQVSFNRYSTTIISLKKINSRKATGYDNLSGKIVRIGVSELSYPLTHLINTSISSISLCDEVR